MSTSLRIKFETYLTLCRYSDKTKRAYISAVAGLAGYFNCSPDQLCNEQIQEYLHYLITVRKLSWSTCNVIFSGLQCFYGKVLGWEGRRFSIPPRPREKRLPMLLSVDEVFRIINSAANLKHRGALLMTVYGAGLRVGEAVRLLPSHIESGRMMIRVEQGKGRKDRYTILPVKLLETLRQYWRKYRPGQWLFPGRDPSCHLSVGSAQKIYAAAKKKAGISKGRGIHTLRHCFVSHLLHEGADIYSLKRWLGHSSIKTTFRYLHTYPDHLITIKSPIDQLQLG